MADPKVKSALEKEAAKILKKFGFPEMEQCVTPANALNRAIPCVTRRMSVMDTCREDVELAIKNNKKDGKATQTLERILVYNCVFEGEGRTVHPTSSTAT